MTEPLLTASEAAKRLGWGLTKFYKLRHTHAIRSMKALNAVGNRCYVAARVDAYNQGESNTRLMRRVS